MIKTPVLGAHQHVGPMIHFVPQQFRRHRPSLPSPIIDSCLQFLLQRRSGKEWQLALFLLSQHVAPDEISCNAAISACAKGRLHRTCYFNYLLALCQSPPITHLAAL